MLLLQVKNAPRALGRTGALLRHSAFGERPYLARDRSVALRWPSNLSIEPADELLVDDAAEAIDVCRFGKAHHNGLRLSPILVSVLLEVDSDRVMSKQQLFDTRDQLFLANKRSLPSETLCSNRFDLTVPVSTSG